MTDNGNNMFDLKSGTLIIATKHEYRIELNIEWI